jgi:hypothetical protein
LVSLSGNDLITLREESVMNTRYTWNDVPRRPLVVSLSCALLLSMAHTALGQFARVINSPPTTIGNNESIGSDTQLNVFDDGTVGTYFSAGASDVAGSNIEVNIFGGSVGRRFRAYDGSRVAISGGSIGDRFWSLDGSRVTISGGEFRLDGVPVAGLESVGDSTALDLPDGALLTGVLADGTPFAFSSLDDDSIAPGTLTVQTSELPPVGPSVITASTDAIPLGIRQGQTLVVDPGGMVGDNFNAGRGSTVNVTGGTVGNYLEVVEATVTISDGSVGGQFDAFGSQVNISGGAVVTGLEAFHGSVVNIMGGSVGNDLIAFPGSQVNISGGAVGDEFEAWDGSQVTISGGAVGEEFDALSGSHVTITGGTIEEVFSAYSGSQVTITGGSLGRWFRAREDSHVTISGGLIGDEFGAWDGSQVNLVGTEFYVDGVVLTDLVVAQPRTITARGVQLTGLLADGSPFRFDLNPSVDDPGDFVSPDATLTVTLVPEPSSVLSSALAILLAIGWRRGLDCSPSRLLQWQQPGS